MDGWGALSQFTSARIALGRAGGSWRTQTLLDFRLAHARARDAVLKEFCIDALEVEIHGVGFETLRIFTDAGERQTFLQRPDLGRRLNQPSRDLLSEELASWGKRDLLVMVSDGLSALATERQSVAVLRRLLPLLADAGWTVYPVLIVPFARVKLQDEVGQLLGARHSLMLLGERPGLGSPDSLGAYFTYHPNVEKSDADRNCISNIRAEGLPPEAAAEKLALWLIESARLSLSGVALKEVSVARQIDG